MELFGEKLREVRESKKYTIDQVARETRISKQYLQALENEDFQVFPGETYLIGFLRSYAEYLDLDPDHYVNLYKNIKIQEQPIPFNELLDMKKKVSPLLVGLTIFLGVALAAAVGFILFITVFNKPVKETIEDTKVLSVQGKKEKTYRFNDEVMTEWFRKGDIILVSLEDDEYPVEVMKAGRETDLKVIEKPVVLSMGIKQSFDLNKDGKPDINLVYNDLKESELGNRVNLGFYKINVLKLVYTEEELAKIEEDEDESIYTGNREDSEEAETASERSEDTREREDSGRTEEVEVARRNEETANRSEERSEETTRRNEETTRSDEEATRRDEETTTPDEETTSNVDVTRSDEEMTEEIDSSLLINSAKIKQETRNVIIESGKLESFIVSFEFRGHCNFSYQIDGKSREYRFYSKDDSLELRAAREMMLWISNANSVKAIIAGESVVMGKAGQVVTKLVYWKKDETSGKYSLEIASVY